MTAPRSRTWGPWMSTVGWFSAITTWGLSPWDSTGSSDARTWTQLWPPRITDWYDVYVNAYRPLRVQTFPTDSGVHALPPPAPPPAWRASGVLSTPGQAGLGPGGQPGESGGPPVQAQTRQALRNIGTILK